MINSFLSLVYGGFLILLYVSFLNMTQGLFLAFVGAFFAIVLLVVGMKVIWSSDS